MISKGNRELENIKEYLKNNIIVSDGATGTYISSLMGRNMTSCELLNITNPELIYNIHNEYILSGAKLIKTNTFAANKISLNLSEAEIKDIIISGINLAKKAANNNVFIAADIGPILQDSWDFDAVEVEYKRIVDIFLSQGIDIFLFETFPSPNYPIVLAEYIKSQNNNAFVITNFAVQPDGYTSMNLKGDKIVKQIDECGYVDAAGFNCISGPAQLLRYAQNIDFGNLTPVLMPNAGYAQLEKDFYSYSNSPAYFAGKLCEATQAGFKIVGGCCGTTPEHIRVLAQQVKNNIIKIHHNNNFNTPNYIKEKSNNAFFEKINYKKIVIAELDPPLNSDITKLEGAVNLLAKLNIDAITIADSPMARARIDSVAVASRLKRTTGMEVIPHLTCRDKNINAIKSTLLAAHMEGIRHILAVTGDPVSETDRGTIKGVFNLNSAGLCSFITDMNDEIFNSDPFVCGCAFNVNAFNIEQEIHKLEKKIKSGAAFILTQPVFSEKSKEALKMLAFARNNNIKIIAGILPPVSYKNAMFLANEIPGIHLPQEFVDKFELNMTKDQGEQIGIEIVTKIASDIAELVDGYYFISPFNRVSVTIQVINQLKALKVL